MNKQKLSKLSSHEKVWRLIHYADQIGHICFIYDRYNLLQSHDGFSIEKDYKKLKSLLVRAKRLRDCINDTDMASNALGISEDGHLYRIDAVYNKGYVLHLFLIDLLHKGNCKRSMQLCLQRGVIVNQLGSEESKDE